MSSTIPQETVLALELATEEEARSFGARLGQCLQPGMTVLLEGPVGAGKSHLARAAIRALAGDEIDVPSPTFTLVQTYDTPRAEIWHADLYRLTDPGEIEELGLADAMGRDILLIEWPDRLGSYRPDGAITLSLSHAGEGRLLRISGAGAALLDCLSEGVIAPGRPIGFSKIEGLRAEGMDGTPEVGTSTGRRS